MTNYWLVKSEPSCYSWQQMQKDNITHWDGVRNYQARNNLRKMKLKDLAFFYHSNDPREIVGIIEVVREAYPDFTDPTGVFDMVDFRCKESLARPISLKEIKQVPELQDISLIKQSRLSVMPITQIHWETISKLAKI